MARVPEEEIERIKRDVALERKRSFNHVLAEAE